MISAAALTRVRTAAVSAPGVSDFVRVNRVEGLALGAGATFPLDPEWSVTARARYGFADQEGKGVAGVRWQSGTGIGASVLAFRRYRDDGDIVEGSLFVNSIAAQEFGADHTDPYDTRGVAAAFDVADMLGLRWSLSVTRESERALSVHALPVTGVYGPTIPALALLGTQVALSADRLSAPGPGGMTWRARVELRGEWYSAADTALPGGVTVGRAFMAVAAEQPFGRNVLAVRPPWGA